MNKPSKLHQERLALALENLERMIGFAQRERFDASRWAAGSPAQW